MVKKKIDWPKVWKYFWKWADRNYPISLDLDTTARTNMQSEIKSLVEEQLRSK